jgi:hypothetical protein
MRMPLARPSFRRLAFLIDFWSMPHFLLGTLVAMVSSVFGYPALPFFFVTLAIAILWEFIEMRFNIHEARINVTSDIITPLFAFMITRWIVGAQTMSHEQHVALLIITIIFYTLVSYAAWRARYDDDPDFQDTIE